MRTTRRGCGPLPEPASLGHLVTAFRANGRASMTLHIADWQVQLTLVRIRIGLIGEATGQVELRAVLLKGTQGITRMWMRQTAELLGMRDYREAAQSQAVWSIRGVLSSESEAVA